VHLIFEFFRGLKTRRDCTDHDLRLQFLKPVHFTSRA